jgi:GT2 family glycosyltransferase
MSHPERLAVVVLNWNNATDTLDCLRSLTASTPPPFVLVIDNGSTDGSAVEIIDSGLAQHVIVNDDNLGYAGGNNVGLEWAVAAGFEFVAVLNNDTIVEPTCLATVLDSLGGEEVRRAASPLIVYADAPEQVWFGGGVLDHGLPRHLRADELQTPRPSARVTPLLTGCCIVARRGVWEQVGPFDPDYFLIFEDSDWSVRATGLGVELVVVGEALLHHRVSRSFARPAMQRLGAFYYGRNGLRFHLRHSRRYVGHFLWRSVLRPGLRSLLRRPGAKDTRFLWLGVFSVLFGSRGAAPHVVQRLARS